VRIAQENWRLGRAAAAVNMVLLVGLCATPSGRASAQIADPADNRCTPLLQRAADALAVNDFKTIVFVERQYLTYCGRFIERHDYLLHLSTLAFGLNGDSQPQEGLGVAEQCLKFNPTDLECLTEKAAALYSLNRLNEARIAAQRALSQGAITTIDAATKQRARGVLAQIDAALGNRPSATVPGQQRTPNSCEACLARPGGCPDFSCYGCVNGNC
jgi:hypothetical protein